MPSATKSVLTVSGAGLGNSSHRTCWSFVRFSAPDREAEYCDERACLSVCVYICLSAVISSDLHVQSSPNFLCMLLMAVARSSCGGVMIRYVLPVL